MKFFDVSLGECLIHKDIFARIDRCSTNHTFRLGLPAIDFELLRYALHLKYVVKVFLEGGVTFCVVLVEKLQSTKNCGFFVIKVIRKSKYNCRG